MYLILIRHAKPIITPEQPAHTWPLSEEGQGDCQALAPHLSPYQPDLVLTSTEPKAQKTGQIVAENLHIPYQIWPNLQEVDRTGVVYEQDQAQFKANVARFFAQPQDLVYGRETAAQAHHRFQTAVQQALTQFPNQTIALTTHGTVMTLFIAYLTQESAFDLWQSLKMPAYAVFSRPTLALINLIPTIPPLNEP